MRVTRCDACGRDPRHGSCDCARAPGECACEFGAHGVGDALRELLGADASDGPVCALLDALLADARVPLPWAVALSAGGREPLQAAWDAERDGHAMVALLTLLDGAPWPVVATEYLCPGIATGLTPTVRRVFDALFAREGAACDVIRGVVPAVPPLAWVLARRAAGTPVD